MKKLKEFITWVGTQKGFEGMSSDQVITALNEMSSSKEGKSEVAKLMTMFKKDQKISHASDVLKATNGASLDSKWKEEYRNKMKDFRAGDEGDMYRNKYLRKKARDYATSVTYFSPTRYSDRMKVARLNQDLDSRKERVAFASDPGDNQISTTNSTPATTPSTLSMPTLKKEVGLKEINLGDSLAKSEADYNAGLKQQQNLNYWLNRAKQFGFKDLNAVRAWQKQHGLVVDGKFGNKSEGMWQYLRKLQFEGSDANKAIAATKRTMDELSQDIYNTIYGSKVKPITEKTPEELQQELAEYRLAKRKEEEANRNLQVQWTLDSRYPEFGLSNYSPHVYTNGR